MKFIKFRYYCCAVKIQSYYKGYKTKKYLNNIFNRLPKDLQNHIVYFIRKDFYIEKLNKKLESLVTKKISKYFMKINDAIYRDNGLPVYSLLYFNKDENYNYILHIHKLFIKYKSILTKKKILLDKLHKILDKIYKNVISDYIHHISNSISMYYYKCIRNLYNYINYLLITNNCIRSFN